MKRLCIIPMVILTVVGLTMSVWADAAAKEAQEMKKDGETAIEQPGAALMKSVPLAEYRPVYRASDIIGMQFRNSDGNLMGLVRDLVLTQDHKQAESLGVVLQGDERVYIVPFKDLQVSMDGETLVSPTTQDHLKQTSNFLINNWPAELENRRVSHLMDATVRGPQDESVGRIRDVIISVEDNQITEATIGIGGIFGWREKLASIDWQQVTLSAQEDYAKINMRESQLEAQAYDKEEYWERLGFSGDRSESQQQFQRRQDRGKELFPEQEVQ